MNQFCNTSHIAVGAGSAYWIVGALQNAGTLEAVPIGGGSLFTVESFLNVWTPLPGVDANYVYWWEAGGLKMAPHTGGSPTTLLLQSIDDAGYAVYTPNDMVLDATSLYWVTGGASGKGDVMRLAKP